MSQIRARDIGASARNNKMCIAAMQKERERDLKVVSRARFQLRKSKHIKNFLQESCMFAEGEWEPRKEESVR